MADNSYVINFLEDFASYVQHSKDLRVRKVLPNIQNAIVAMRDGDRNTAFRLIDEAMEVLDHA